MTSPEWLAADEDDSDRFPAPHASAQISTHSPDEGSRVVPDPARVARYAEAIGVRACEVAMDCEPIHVACLDLARAVVAVADEERAAPVAEVERLRAELATARAESIRELQSAVRAAIRAEAAEAKVAKVEALFSGGPDTACRTTSHEGVEFVEVPMDELRAVLADAPAEEPPLVFVDKETHEPCPTRGKTLCTILDPDHLHVARHMLPAEQRPCGGENANVCVAEGCYGEACIAAEGDDRG